MPGAQIILSEAVSGQFLSGAISDSSGRSMIPDSIALPFRLKVELAGFKSVDSLVTQTDDIKIVLSERKGRVDEITVTGTMLPTTIKQSPVKTEVVSTKAIQDYLPGTTNMMETLKMVNGITEQVGCGVCFTNSISINGLPGPYTAVLLDGAPVFGNLATVYGLNGVPNVAVEKYEVIKGPNSTLYGSEALAGVINIITKNPKEKGYSGDAVVSTNNEVFANISTNQNFGSLNGLISANLGRVGNIVDANQDGFGDMLNLERYTGFTKWNYNSNFLDFSLGANIYYEDRRNGVLTYLENYDPSLRGNDDIYGESIVTTRNTLFGSIESRDMSYGKLDFSLSLYSQDSYYGNDQYQANQDMYWLNYIYPIASETHTLLLGATSRLSSYNDNTQATENNGIDQAEKQFIPGVFVQSEWDMTTDMKLLSGLRLDHYNRHGAILSPRLSFKWSPSYDWDFRINSGTGFRVVNLFTEDHAFVTGQRQVLIEEELRPEQSYNITASSSYFYDLGIGWGSGSIDGDIFYTHFQNKIIPDYSRDGLIVYSNTEGSASTQGVAFNINHTFDFDLTLTVGMTFLESIETEVIDGIKSSKELPYSPDYTGVIMANYLWKWADIVVGYSARITGPQVLPQVFDVNPTTGQPFDSSRPTISEAFAIHGLQITKRTDYWDFYIGAQNIGDFMQSLSPLAGYNDPNSQPGFSEFFDTAYAYSPIHGRELYLGIRMNY